MSSDFRLACRTAIFKFEGRVPITIKSISASEVRKYCDFGAGEPMTNRLKVIGQIMDWLEAEQLTNEVFFSIGLSGLLVSDRPVFVWGENMLKIDAVRSPDFVVFEYSRIDGSTDIDRKHCQREDAVEYLREYLAYKFGIHRPKREIPINPPDSAPKLPQS